MGSPKTIIVALLGLTVALGQPVAATAQTPASNASGAQYLPSVPAGSGNRTEASVAAEKRREQAADSAAAEPEEPRLGPWLGVGLAVPLLLALIALLPAGRARPRM